MIKRIIHKQTALKCDYYYLMSGYYNIFSIVPKALNQHRSEKNWGPLV